jgi:hypothetical protein
MAALGRQVAVCDGPAGVRQSHEAKGTEIEGERPRAGAGEAQFRRRDSNPD